MAKKEATFSIEDLVSEAGSDVEAAKASLAGLKGVFAGDVPDGALSRWVDEFFDATRARKFFMALGREWLGAKK